MITSKKKTVPIDQIKIPRSFRKPRPEKINASYSFFLQHGYIDRVIVITDKNYLIDGYVGYLIAKMAGFKRIRVLQVKEGYEA